jgi:hypothetical protein
MTAGMAAVTAAAGLAAMAAWGACAPRTAQPDAPALLTAPTGEARAELLRVVSGAMNGAPVTLAAGALTNDDTLIVERAESRDTKDMNLGGREMRRPDHFRLVKSGAACVLIHVESGRRWTLSSANCSPR